MDGGQAICAHFIYCHVPKLIQLDFKSVIAYESHNYVKGHVSAKISRPDNDNKKVHETETWR